MNGVPVGRPVLALAAVLLTGLAACGVPQDPQPRAIPADRVPFGLLDTEALPSASSAGEGLDEVVVYLVAQERLAGATRKVQGPVTAETVIRALLGGPTAEEAARGLRSALDSSVELSTRGRTGVVVAVELGETFSTTGATDEILAVAQIVYTLTALTGIEAVRFMVEGEPIEVPAGDGTLRSAPVGRADFGPVSPSVTGPVSPPP
ncbi:MAG: GerMN domain-containing protein [Acidimicrobiia bacterium]